jgi:hypothetical protein
LSGMNEHGKADGAVPQTTDPCEHQREGSQE